MGLKTVVGVASWGYEATPPAAQQPSNSVPAAVGVQWLLERRKVQEPGVWLREGCQRRSQELSILESHHLKGTVFFYMGFVKFHSYLVWTRLDGKETTSSPHVFNSSSLS